MFKNLFHLGDLFFIIINFFLGNYRRLGCRQGVACMVVSRLLTRPKSRSVFQVHWIFKMFKKIADSGFDANERRLTSPDVGAAVGCRQVT